MPINMKVILVLYFIQKMAWLLPIDAMKKSGREIELSILFEVVSGFQYLDEGDLANYWKSGITGVSVTFI